MADAQIRTMQGGDDGDGRGRGVREDGRLHALAKRDAAGGLFFFRSGRQDGY
jgi:hypothetical protein